VSVHTHWGKFA